VTSRTHLESLQCWKWCTLMITWKLLNALRADFRNFFVSLWRIMFLKLRSKLKDSTCFEKRWTRNWSVGYLLALVTAERQVVTRHCRYEWPLTEKFKLPWNRFSNWRHFHLSAVCFHWREFVTCGVFLVVFFSFLLW
jgi:hypothetical protein